MQRSSAVQEKGSNAHISHTISAFALLVLDIIHLIAHLKAPIIVNILKYKGSN